MGAFTEELEMRERYGYDMGHEDGTLETYTSAVVGLIKTQKMDLEEAIDAIVMPNKYREDVRRAVQLIITN